MSKQIVEVFSKNTTRIKSIAFHPTNSVIITANHCGTVYMWNYLYQQIIAVLHEHQGSVRVVKIHPSGELFATAGDDKIIRIWNYKTRMVVQKLKGHSDFVRCLDFHPTKPWIVSGSDDFTIKVWNFYTGELLSTSCGQTHYIMSVLFLDSTHILSGSLDHTMSLWSCANLFEKKKFMVPDVIVLQQIDAHSRGVNCMFLADGKVISGSDDKEVKVWKYADETLNIDKAIYTHEGNVNAVFYNDNIIYAGGEDSILSCTQKGKSHKIPLESRIWAINGRDEYLAVGTDDGLIFYRTSIPLSFCISGTDIYYSIGQKVLRYNSKQSIDLFNTKNEIINLVKHNDLLYVNYDDHYEAYRDGRKESGEDGSIIFVGNDKYQIKNSSLYKNDELYRSDIAGRMYSNGKILAVVSKKTVTRIEHDNELSSSFNFLVNSVQFEDDKMAIIGSNKILMVDKDFKVTETINELVEITGGFFYEDLFIYTTLRHAKFFYEGTGILQSIEAYSLPATVANDCLILLSSKGIEKILLNFSEIRFRRAVRKDENILSVIEEEQLPGLSPLEYLINKNKGGIALPYIKNDEKRFQLFISDDNFDEALKLSNSYKMNEELAFAALQKGRYDISEICFKKNQDNLNLFYLYMSTKQLNKMRDLEGDDIENMVKIILDDKSLLSCLTGQKESENIGESDYVSNVNDSMKTDLDKHSDSVNLETINKSPSQNYSNDVPNIYQDDVNSVDASSELSSDQNEPENLPDIKSLSIKGKKSENDSSEHSCQKICGSPKDSKSINKDENLSEESNEPNATVIYKDSKSINKDENLSEESNNYNASDIHSISSSLKFKESSTDSESSSDLRTDLATYNDSDLQIFDFSAIKIPENLRKEDFNIYYQEALDFTTQGKFLKAIESFRIAISLIALRIKNPSDYLTIRRRIGNYLLGLYIEKERKKIENPLLNVEMSLFFASLDLESVHIPLVKNLALTNCYKHGNFKTAKEIAGAYPMCKNAPKVLESKEETDSMKFIIRPFAYGTLYDENNLKECALCGVKSKENDLCPACEIGCLQ